VAQAFRTDFVEPFILSRVKTICWYCFRLEVFPYALELSHNTSVTDGQRDRQTTTTMPIARLLLKYGRLKVRRRYLYCSIRLPAFH